jgi:phosphohistidine phosphatase
VDPGSPTDIAIYLLRHAHAGDPARWSGDDAERPLSARGREQARRLGRFLAERALMFDTIVSSPKKRARQTAELFADAFGVGVAIDDRLGGPLDVDLLSDVIEGAGGTSIVLVGHDPDFSELCGSLTGSGYLPLRKGALARIDAAVPLQAGAGVLRWLLPPDLLAERS